MNYLQQVLQDDHWRQDPTQIQGVAVYNGQRDGDPYVFVELGVFGMEDPTASAHAEQRAPEAKNLIIQVTVHPSHRWYFAHLQEAHDAAVVLNPLGKAFYRVDGVNYPAADYLPPLVPEQTISRTFASIAEASAWIDSLNLPGVQTTAPVWTTIHTH